MDAAKRAGGGEAGVKAAVAAGQPTTGPANATIDKGSVAASMAAFKPTAPLKPSTPINSNNKPKLQMNSYKWSSEKTAEDVASAYASIYEAKKKVDQDEDGDNDFADVRIARMIASGVPKAKAIAMVKNKSYNEEVEAVDEKYMGFKKLEASIAARGGVRDPGAVAASIGRKKYGKEKFQKAAAKGRKMNEATVMAKRGYDETEIRNKIAKSTGGGKFADKATELENRPTFGDKSKQAARDTLARKQRGDFRRTTSSDYGLRLGAHKSDDPAVKAKQAARGKQRSALTPNEKKMLNREAYETYELVASYLLENNFATTIEDADVIINNMSENWFGSIIEEKKPLPVAKMKRKEEKLDRELESELPTALKTKINSPERKKLLGKNRRFGDMNDVRRSVSTRGGKRPLQMPEVGRFKPKDED